MRYLKVVIFILIIVSVALVSYYLYLRLGPSKTGKINNSDSERTIQIGNDSGSGTIVSEIVDYTSADVEPGKTIKIQGRFQSGDPVQKVMGDTSYVYVVGVLKEDNSLAKVWLTQVEYEKIRDLIEWEKGSIAPGQPILLNLSKDSVDIVRI